MERKVAILFADVSGSAKVYERLGDAEAEHAVDRCVKRMERAIEAFGGRLVKVVGDEIMAVFVGAEEACQAAIEMQQRIVDLPPVSGVKLAIRVGFHLGPVIEAGGEPQGETVDTAARIVGLAKSGQILSSVETAARLPGQLRESVRDDGQAADRSGSVPVLEIVWRQVGEPSPKAAPQPATEAPVARRAAVQLRLRYRGQVYIIDDKMPVVSLGRDPGSDIVVEDRKASRHHGRIEKRQDRFFYVDRSTNGSYVALAGTQETMVRHTEIVLQGSGTICFGASGNDPKADCATFEKQ